MYVCLWFTDHSTILVSRKFSFPPLYRSANISSDYAAKVFGFHTFGKVYGLIICLAGLFNFLQTPLDALTHKTFGGNPRPINLILLAIAMVVGFSLTFFVYKQTQILSKEALRREADQAEERLLPAGNGQDNSVETRDYGTI
jgi:multisubunit Na+/H+ antiporter MnhC subunit